MPDSPEAIEAIGKFMPETARHLASGDPAKIAAALINATGGLSNRHVTPDEAHEIIALLRAAAPEAFVVFQAQLCRDMGQPGYEQGAYDSYIIDLS